MSKVIVIVGPTASGKSALAVRLAQKIHGEIISADSRQVYRGMNLGTGKITRKEMMGIPHHLINVVSPRQNFTVSHYQKLAKEAIKKIIDKKRTPIVVGGTGLYIQSLIDGISIPAVKPDSLLRRTLQKKTAPELFSILKRLDPRRARNIEKDNPRRLIRAIEIVKKTGKPVPSLKINPLPYPVLFIGTKKNKKELKKLIHRRLAQRLKKGMLKEIQRLKESGVSWRRLQDFGLEYRYISFYLQGKISYQEMRSKLEKAIEHYAKRQITWFKRDARIHWIKTKQEALSLSRKFINSKLP